MTMIELPKNLPPSAWCDEEFGIALYCGDSFEVLAELPDGVAAGLVTDPPYSSGGQYRGDRVMTTVAKYVTTGVASALVPRDFTGDNRDQRAFAIWCNLWLGRARATCESGAVLCCFSDWRQVPTLSDCLQVAGWTWRNLCTWWKPGCRMQKGRFSSSAEFLLYGSNGPLPMSGADSPQNVISQATLTNSEKEHIAAKPVEVAAWSVSVVRPGGLVVDPFLGSGTTALACVQSGRPFIGIDCDPYYVEVASKRIRDEIIRAQCGPLFATHQPPLFPNSPIKGDEREPSFALHVDDTGKRLIDRTLTGEGDADKDLERLA